MDYQPNLEPDGIDYLAEDKQRKNPESAEDWRQDELQPGPNTSMKGRVTLEEEEKREAGLMTTQ